MGQVEGGSAVVERLLLRPREASVVLGLSRSAIYQLISAGRIPSVKIGRSIRIPLAELRAWVASKASEG